MAERLFVTAFALDGEAFVTTPRAFILKGSRIIPSGANGLSNGEKIMTKMLG